MILIIKGHSEILMHFEEIEFIGHNKQNCCRLVTFYPPEKVQEEMFSAPCNYYELSS